MNDTDDARPGKPWLKSYPQGVPAEIEPASGASIGSLFELAAKKFGPLGAFTCMGSTMTYSEVDAACSRFGSFLRLSGLAPGDRVALMMPNLLQYPVALLGALRAGLVVINVNPLYTPGELEHQLADSGSKALVVVENFAKTFEAVASKFPGMLVVTTELGDLLPAPKRWLVNTVAKRVKRMVPEFDLPGATSFRRALATGAAAGGLHPHPCGPDDLAFLQYTGGTTGVAKGAMLTHGNIVSNLRQSGAWISSKFKPGSEVAVSPLPLYHIFCLTSMLCFMTWGARNVLVPNPRDIPALSKLLAKEPWTILTGVNTLFNALLDADGVARGGYPYAKLCLGGGAAIQRSVGAAWKAAAGIEITEAYGLTETSPAATVNPVGSAVPGSIGLPLPSTEVSIRTDAFQRLAPWDGSDPVEAHVGEICVKGPQVMRGYWGRPDETAKAVRDGWLLTGDVGYMDAGGFVYITDRKKDMVLVSGFNVYPTEVEEAISSCPGVLESAVVGVSDPRSGEAVKAFVVRKDPSLTDRQVIEHCKTKLAAYKVPRQVEFRESLPKSPVGKILRRHLRER